MEAPRRSSITVTPAPERTTTSKMEVESEGAVKRGKVSAKKTADTKKQKGLAVQIKRDNGETAETNPDTEDGAHSLRDLKHQDPDLNGTELLLTNPTPGSEGGAQRSPEGGRGM